MKTLPPNATAYKRTPLFTANTVPDGLLSDHHTKAGVWGLIRVESGSVEYVIDNRETHTLTSDRPGVIEPQIMHFVRPGKDSAFFVEFYRQPDEQGKPL